MHLCQSKTPRRGIGSIVVRVKQLFGFHSPVVYKQIKTQKYYVCGWNVNQMSTGMHGCHHLGMLESMWWISLICYLNVFYKKWNKFYTLPKALIYICLDLFLIIHEMYITFNLCFYWSIFHFVYWYHRNVMKYLKTNLLKLWKCHV